MNRPRPLYYLDGVVREERAWQSVTAKYIVGQCAHLVLDGIREHRVNSIMRPIKNSTIDHAGSSAIKYGTRQRPDPLRIRPMSADHQHVVSGGHELNRGIPNLEHNADRVHADVIGHNDPSNAKTIPGRRQLMLYSIPSIKCRD